MSTQSETNNEYIEVDIPGFLQIIKRRKWLIALLTFLTVLITGMLLFLVVPPVYEVQTSYMVVTDGLGRTGDPNTLEQLGVMSFFPRMPELNVQTCLEQVKDPVILSGIITHLNLPQKVYSLKSLAEDIKVANIKDTSLIEVRIQNKSPETALRIAQTLTDLMQEAITKNSKQLMEQYITILKGKASDLNNELVNEVNRQNYLTNRTPSLAVLRQNHERALAELNRTRVSLESAAGKFQEPTLELRRLEFEQLINELESEINDRAETENEIQKNLANLTKASQLLEERITQLKLAGSLNMGASTLQVISPPTLLDQPVKPKKLLNITIAGILGLFGAIFLAAYLETSRKKIYTRQDVEKYFDISVLGIVPQYLTGNLVSYLRPHSVETEAFKILRTNLTYCLKGKSCHSLLFTSTVFGEGKSTILSNLAVTLAQAGKRVLVIDADLRSPVQHKIFFVANKVGLADCLRGTHTTAEIIFPTIVPGVFLLPAGMANNPAELLSTGKMQELLQDLSISYDYILLDSPPVLVVADSRLLATTVDGVVFIISSGKCSVDPAREAVEQLRLAGATIHGLILNRVAHSKSERSYYDYYSFRNDHKRRVR